MWERPDLRFFSVLDGFEQEYVYAFKSEEPWHQIHVLDSLSIILHYNESEITLSFNVTFLLDKLESIHINYQKIGKISIKMWCSNLNLKIASLPWPDPESYLCIHWANEQLKCTNWHMRGGSQHVSSALIQLLISIWVFPTETINKTWEKHLILPAQKIKQIKDVSEIKHIIQFKYHYTFIRCRCTRFNWSMVFSEILDCAFPFWIFEVFPASQILACSIYIVSFLEFDGWWVSWAEVRTAVCQGVYVTLKWHWEVLNMLATLAPLFQ